MSKTRKSSVSDAERAALSRFQRAIDPFREVRATMPLQYVSTFLLVATEEHENVSEYAKRAGISQSLMTRHLSDLGETNRYHEEGMGLVEGYDDLMDRRNRLIRLTTKGKTLVWKIMEGLK